MIQNVDFIAGIIINLIKIQTNEQHRHSEMYSTRLEHQHDEQIDRICYLFN